jgi:hypothetical protein
LKGTGICMGLRPTLVGHTERGFKITAPRLTGVEVTVSKIPVYEHSRIMEVKHKCSPPLNVCQDMQVQVRI